MAQNQPMDHPNPAPEHPKEGVKQLHLKKNKICSFMLMHLELMDVISLYSTPFQLKVAQLYANKRFL